MLASSKRENTMLSVSIKTTSLGFINPITYRFTLLTENNKKVLDTYLGNPNWHWRKENPQSFQKGMNFFIFNAN